jgi:hypothetical protein
MKTETETESEIAAPCKQQYYRNLSVKCPIINTETNDTFAILITAGDYSIDNYWLHQSFISS